MTRALRNISASVEKRLLNLSRQSGEDFLYVLMRYGLERLMYRLSRSVYAKEFIVEGAVLLRVWTGEQYRPTKDLDLLAIVDKSPEELDQISSSEFALPASFVRGRKHSHSTSSNRFPCTYGCDGNGPIVDPINYAITISKPLTNISSPNSGTIRPARESGRGLRVVLRIVFTTVAA